MPFRRAGFALTPPSVPVFTAAVLLVALGALVHYKILAVRALAGLSAYSFELVLAGAILLIIGALLRGV